MAPPRHSPLVDTTYMCKSKAVIGTAKSHFRIDLKTGRQSESLKIATLSSADIIVQMGQVQSLTKLTF